MIKAILAMDENKGMGKDGSLPWPKNSEDLKHFKNKTFGCSVIMGSKTWDDPCFPAPLDGRDNLVISSKGFENFKGATVLSKNLNDFIQYLDSRNMNDTWVIGGSSIFEQLHDIIDEYHITEIEGDFDCDVFFNQSLEDFILSDRFTSTTSNIYKIYKRKY